MPSYVTDYTALLTNGTYRWNGAASTGTPVTIAYSFLKGNDLPTTSELPPVEPGEINNYVAMDSTRQAATRLALDEFSSVTGVQFVEVDSLSLSNILFLSNEGTGDYSWAYYPDSDQGTSSTSAVVMTEDLLNQYDAEWNIGGSMFTLLLHEIGHAMGLEHSHEGTLLDPTYDNHNHTVMSYDWTWSGTVSPTYNTRSTLARLDVDALEYLYGDETFSDLGWTTAWNNSTEVFSLTGNSDDDILIGLRADSVIRGKSGADELYGQGGDDKLYGDSGADYIFGGDGNDRAYSGSGTDIVYLGNGNDYVKAGGGQEKFYGDSGKDYISYYDSANGVNVNLATNVVSGSWASNDTISGFESVSGSRTGDDKIYGTSGSNTIKTYGGDDRVYAGAGSDKVSLGDGNDYVRVGGGAEEFHGGSGKDYISYYDSTNGVNINLATNVVSGSLASNDTISGFESVSGSRTGDDKIYGTSGSNTIKTYGGDDRVYAGAGSDKVYLGDGNDYVRVGGGLEEFHGGSGKDYISYYDSANGVTIDLQADTVSRSLASNDVISGFESASGSKTGDDKIYGTAGSNTLKSYGGDDKLYGRSGDDKMVGGDGADRFDGGAGTDTLYGEGGADIFHFDLGEDHDIIKDFEDDVDVIELDNFIFGVDEDAFDFAAQVDSDVVFDFGEGDMLTVENTTIAQLHNDLEMV